VPKGTEGAVSSHPAPSNQSRARDAGSQPERNKTIGEICHYNVKTAVPP
jgi:hypothetical protein